MLLFCLLPRARCHLKPAVSCVTFNYCFTERQKRKAVDGLAFRLFQLRSCLCAAAQLCAYGASPLPLESCTVGGFASDNFPCPSVTS